MSFVKLDMLLKYERLISKANGNPGVETVNLNVKDHTRKQFL